MVYSKQIYWSADFIYTFLVEPLHLRLFIELRLLSKIITVLGLIPGIAIPKMLQTIKYGMDY